MIQQAKSQHKYKQNKIYKYLDEYFQFCENDKYNYSKIREFDLSYLQTYYRLKFKQIKNFNTCTIFNFYQNIFKKKSMNEFMFMIIFYCYIYLGLFMFTSSIFKQILTLKHTNLKKSDLQEILLLQVRFTHFKSSEYKILQNCLINEVFSYNILY
ncbi:transmembrane protein, putative (macronuclear) [Tetrahymena thermophila SB210]|uniref:Transmembrane protein, putative n=1 Tax=Tetrahymena thermophila (strain SB210) TaxID=312017 RepID=W7WYK0_TETTS|nr:transmembrane protein, putative [Tetrahymena thermophila SB210]EWS71955.1 transmembrane protein, putative [Tetrahymena thermophila SB210]|eukprot:XP_012655515.1 transmembrane protein, putative [Tetrahymena thermophila SB210]